MQSKPIGYYRMYCSDVAGECPSILVISYVLEELNE